MVKTDTIEGTVNNELRFHYDVYADVLYLRLVEEEDSTAYGDITEEGDILLRDEKTDKPIGLTVVSWWERFGKGTFPDSISEIQRQIEPLAGKLAA